MPIRSMTSAFKGLSLRYLAWQDLYFFLKVTTFQSVFFLSLGMDRKSLPILSKKPLKNCSWYSFLYIYDERENMLWSLVTFITLTANFGNLSKQPVLHFFLSCRHPNSPKFAFRFEYFFDRRWSFYTGLQIYSSLERAICLDWSARLASATRHFSYYWMSASH